MMSLAHHGGVLGLRNMTFYTQAPGLLSLWILITTLCGQIHRIYIKDVVA
jgi:hypothetical protein